MQIRVIRYSFSVFFQHKNNSLTIENRDPIVCETNGVAVSGQGGMRTVTLLELRSYRKIRSRDHGIQNLPRLPASTRKPWAFSFFLEGRLQ
jgi:hypothetical protein